MEIAVTTENISEIFYAKERKEILEIFTLLKGVRRMTPEIKRYLTGKGYLLKFRGFNSHSKDCYLYKYRGNFYISFGVANVNGAGRGYEKSVKVKKKFRV